MGIFIKLNVLMDKIEEKEWEAVYQESLQLINAYSFADRIVDKESSSRDWVYLDRSRERVLKPWHDEVGWYTIGNLETMETAEDFKLIRNKKCYKHNVNCESDCEEIFFSIINYWNLDEEIQNQNPASYRIFDSKTQGLAYHQYILAIACLLESRLAPYAVVSGDVSKGQMEKAIAWANTILEQPIELTERAHNEKLLARLQKCLTKETSLFEAWINLTVNNDNQELGDFIRNKFSQESIVAYFTKLFKEYDPESVGFGNQVKSYFNLHFSLEMLCDICVLNENGCRLSVEFFIKRVIDSGILTREKAVQQDLRPASQNATSTKPDTVDSLFYKTFMKMKGHRQPTKQYLSVTEFKAICTRKFGEDSQIIKMIEEKLSQARDEEGSIINEFEKIIKANLSENQRGAELQNSWDIEDFTQLINWQVGKTIAPEIVEALNKVKLFVEELIVKDHQHFTEFHNYHRQKRLETLIEANRYFCITKKSWDYIEQRLDDRDFIARVLGVFYVKAEEININRLLKSVLCNMDLFNKFVNTNNE